MCSKKVIITEVTLRNVAKFSRSGERVLVQRLCKCTSAKMLNFQMRNLIQRSITTNKLYVSANHVS